MKRIIYILCALVLVCTGCEKDRYDVTTITKTEITPHTSTADVTIYVADQNDNTSSATIEEAGVFLSTQSEPTTNDERLSVSNSEEWKSEYSFSIEGLASNTTYYALPFVSNRLGMVTGKVVSFTTAGTARVTTKAATEITATSAQLNGTVAVDAANVKIEERGFVLATVSNPTIQTSGASAFSVAGTTGDYSRIYTGLQSNTRYYFRAFVQVNGEILYGNVMNFTTLDPQSSALGSKVSDFVGTYSAKAFCVDDQKYYTWDNVTITTFTAPTTNTEWVSVLGLQKGWNYFYALGEFDANYKAVRLYSNWYFTDEGRFALSGHGDTVFVAKFFPVSVDKNDIKFTSWHVISDGDGYDDTGEAFLTFNSAGELVLGPAATADSEGYKANGYNFCVFYDESGISLGWYEAWVELTLTKTSSTVKAPAKIRQAVNQEWHAPMKLPLKVKDTKPLRRM